MPEEYVLQDIFECYQESVSDIDAFLDYHDYEFNELDFDQD